MRDLRTFTYLFRLSVKAFGLFVTYVTMCLNLFWIRLKLSYNLKPNYFGRSPTYQTKKLRNMIQNRLLTSSDFFAGKNKDYFQNIVFGQPIMFVKLSAKVFSISMDGDLGLICVFSMKILKISISVHPCFVSGDYVSFGFIISEW